MINKIWFFLLVVGIIVGMITGNIQEITDAAINGAQDAVTLSLGLIGIMAMWLGFMNIAEKSGLIYKVSSFLKPLLKWLFPDVPSNHPALGSIALNMTANLFGLGNAATPFGLKAMEELQSINENKDSASDSMCMLLALNTAAITLIPTTVIAYRAAAGSENPANIIGPTALATVIACFASVTAAKIFSKLYKKKK